MSGRLISKEAPGLFETTCLYFQFYMNHQPQRIHVREHGKGTHVEGVDCSSGKRSRRSKPGRMCAVSMQGMHDSSLLSAVDTSQDLECVSV